MPADYKIANTKTAKNIAAYVFALEIALLAADAVFI